MLHSSSSTYAGFGRSPTAFISTPAVLKHGQFPWVAKTPDNSPMPYGTKPSVEAVTAATPAAVSQSAVNCPSRELLRAVCEPFLDQMITAMQIAMAQHHEQLQQPQDHLYQEKQAQHQWLSASLLDSVSTITDARTACGHTSSFSHPSSGSMPPTVGEESCDTDESGAFATLFSCPSSSESCCENEECSSEHSPGMSFQTASNTPICGDLEPGREQRKSVMVCRHWKQKGFCRMESDCKFQHPEEKRGPKLPKGGTKAADSTSSSAAANLCDDMTVRIGGGRKKRSRGKRARKAASPDNTEQQEHSKSIALQEALPMYARSAPESLLASPSI